MKIIDLSPELFISVSERHDGSMKNPKLVDWADEEITKSIKNFLQQSYIDTKNTALIAVNYERENFCEYHYINSTGKFTISHKVSTIPISDGLVTMSDNLAFFLPLADCVGVVLFDSKKKLLMVVHAGRHNLEQNGLVKAVEFMKKYGGNPKTTQAWLSPSAGAENYPMHAYENKSLEQVAIEQLKIAGIRIIKSAEIDTTTDKNYYSHSQGDLDSRFAILAYIK